MMKERNIKLQLTGSSAVFVLRSWLYCFELCNLPPWMDGFDFLKSPRVIYSCISTSVLFNKHITYFYMFLVGMEHEWLFQMLAF
jgi:hypothetical protein